jgi:hypothetical protein
MINKKCKEEKSNMYNKKVSTFLGRDKQTPKCDMIITKSSQFL